MGGSAILSGVLLIIANYRGIHFKGLLIHFVRIMEQNLQITLPLLLL